jgi:hypothetical protein
LIQAQLRGFIISHRISVESVTGARAALLEGVIECAGGIRIEVDQTLSIAMKGQHSFAEVISYGYKAVLGGDRVIFRYDPPHVDHNRFHHKHVCDVFGSGATQVIPLYQLSAVPTIREVIEEAEGWFHEHADRLRDETER